MVYSGAILIYTFLIQYNECTTILIKNKCRLRSYDKNSIVHNTIKNNDIQWQ